MVRISESPLKICYGIIDIPNMAKIECKNLMFKQLTSFDYIYLVFSRLDFHLVN